MTDSVRGSSPVSRKGRMRMEQNRTDARPGQFLEIHAKTVCGQGKMEFRRTAEIPLRGEPLRQILGSLATDLQVDSTRIDPENPTIVKVQGAIGVHVWYMGREETQVASAQVAVSGDVPLTLVDGTPPLDALTTVTSEPVTIKAQQVGNAIGVNLETTIEVEAIGETRIMVKALPPGYVGSRVKPQMDTPRAIEYRKPRDVGDRDDED